MVASFAYMLIGVIAPATLPAGHAGAFEQRFRQAQAHFEAARAQMAAGSDDALEARRMFREAAEQFAALAADGAASANLYVNTGNAYHFAGDEPRALLWYLRASQIANTPEIRAGLATLRRVCKAELWAPARPSIARVLMFWHFDIGRRTKQAVLLTLYPAGCALVIASLFAPRRKRWLRTGLVLAAIGGLMGVSDAVAACTGGESWAVVLSQTKGYAGDGQMYSVVADAIAPGQEVKIVEARRDWMQVELPSGGRCWVSTNVCEPVGQTPST
jgi:hypothetical protein